jgi:hypothetical protein
VESVTRSRAFPGAQVAVAGRSLTCAAGAPYEVEQTWSIDGDTTAAQIAATANLYTGLDVVWGVQDWPIPAGVFGHFGTPLGVVKRVAEAVDALVQSDRTGYTVRVLPRYPLLPNEWATVAPDVEVHLGAIESESFERKDQPAYDGVYLFGQQQGAAAVVRLAGTSGANLHPPVTELLLTDDVACAERGAAILGASGQRQDHTLRVPVLTGGTYPGMFSINWLARIVEPTETWYGLVRRVSVSVQLPSVQQTVVLERHLGSLAGTTAAPALPAPLKFTGPVAAQSVATSTAFTLSLASFFSLGVPPYSYSRRGDPLPSWLTLNPSTGVLSGTTPAVGSASTVQVRATDTLSSTADSNAFSITVTAPPSAPPGYLVLGRFDGTNGATTVVNEGSAGGNFVADSSKPSSVFSLSTTQVKYGSTALKLDGVASPTSDCFVKMDTGQLIPVDAYTVRGWVYFGSGSNTASMALAWDLTNFSTAYLQINLASTSGGAPVVSALTVDEITFTPTFFGSTAISANTWTHVELGLSATGTARLFVNGVQVASAFVGPLLNTGGGVAPSVAYLDSQGRVSYVDDFACVLGYAATANFTPPGAL